ncbi:hypothetical protein E8E12_001321 [Didymella heteroderae]|uniref:Apple domain-containing protein n=1 Tax=Didymella heteroderae TaxID=1769908 RepID=A0A9P5BW54_9PLEO|nr:hypothetical protein E8E12_001321 [Didymella heteroderae]
MSNAFYGGLTSFTLCSSYCLKDSRCEAFRYSYWSDAGSQYCEFFDVDIFANFTADSTSPYYYYDRGCAFPPFEDPVTVTSVSTPAAITVTSTRLATLTSTLSGVTITSTVAGADPSSANSDNYCQLHRDCNSICICHIHTNTSSTDQYGLLRRHADSASADKNSVLHRHDNRYKYGDILPHSYSHGYNYSSDTNYASTASARNNNQVLDEDSSVDNNQCSILKNRDNDS